MVGSCLGPLLFSIFTNDLPYAVENAIVMYADDSTLYYAANTNNELNDVVSQELDIVHECLKHCFTVQTQTSCWVKICSSKTSIHKMQASLSWLNIDEHSDIS